MNGDAITAAVNAVMNNGVDYTASGDLTHCSDFVRDFWAKVGLPPQPDPDLANQANDQVTAMQADSSAWSAFPLNGVSDADLQTRFNQADSDATQGKVVLVGWLNPDWTGAGDTDHHGHIAIIVPSAGDALQTSTTWPNLMLPFIAQAGPNIGQLNGSVFGKIKLSWGFGIERKPGMTIFTNIQ